MTATWDDFAWYLKMVSSNVIFSVTDLLAGLSLDHRISI